MLLQDLQHPEVRLRPVLPGGIVADADAFERIEQAGAHLLFLYLHAPSFVVFVRRAQMLDVQPADAVEKLALVFRHGQSGGVPGVHRPVFRRHRKIGPHVHQHQKRDGHKRHHQIERNLSATHHNPWSFR